MWLKGKTAEYFRDLWLSKQVNCIKTVVKLFFIGGKGGVKSSTPGQTPIHKADLRDRHSEI
jgi:hypothetical protein